MVQQARAWWSELSGAAKAGAAIGAALLAIGGAWGGAAVSTPPGLTETQVGGIVGDSLRPIRAAIDEQGREITELYRQTDFLVCGDLARAGVDGYTEGGCTATYLLRGAP